MTDKKLISFHSGVVKDINEQLVLKLIQEHERISSSELVKLTGMRPSTIFNILKELSAKSFVSFYGKGESTKKGGKKPYIWNLNHEVAYTIGLDIEVGEITCIVLDFGGTIKAKRIIKLETGRTPDELTSNIVNVVNGIIDEQQIDRAKILGLGVAFAGIVDTDKGIVSMTSVIPEINFPLLEKLSIFPFPVIIENNANAAAVGLKWKNSGRPDRNYLSILVEIDKNVSGLGLGIVIDGELYRGSSYCAGELYPHLPSLKEILSKFRSRFYESNILQNYIQTFDSIDIEFLLDAAKSGDRISQLVFEIIGSMVGETIAPAVSLLNPDLLVITGNISELDVLIVKTIRKEIEMRVVPLTNDKLNIVVDKHHQYSVAVGAASLILEDFFRILPKKK